MLFAGKQRMGAERAEENGGIYLLFYYLFISYLFIYLFVVYNMIFFGLLFFPHLCPGGYVMLYKKVSR